MATRATGRIIGDHKLTTISHTTNEFGRFPRKWKCQTCGKVSSSRDVFEDDPCPDPVLWARMGCPGDGLFACHDCDAVWVDTYDRAPAHEADCPACGGLHTYRDDDPDIDQTEVIKL